jgi:hypothetical protein
MSKQRVPRAKPKDDPVQSITLESARPFSLEGRELRVKILEVIDGNLVLAGFFMFRIQWVAKCCLSGHVCPSARGASDARDAGVRARESLAKMIGGRVVNAAFGPNDKYGRAQVRLTLDDGRDVSGLMIAEGSAGIAARSSK